MTTTAPMPYAHLPLYAKIAIERLDRQSEYRCAAQLDDFLDAYSFSYGEKPDQWTRESCHHIAARRFWDFKA